MRFLSRASKTASKTVGTKTVAKKNRILLTKPYPYPLQQCYKYLDLVLPYGFRPLVFEAIGGHKP